VISDKVSFAPFASSVIAVSQSPDSERSEEEGAAKQSHAGDGRQVNSLKDSSPGGLRMTEGVKTKQND